MLIPRNPVDKGYINIKNYKLDSVNFLGKRLTIRFANINNQECFNIYLDNIVSYNWDFKTNKLFYLRLDSDGSSYGLDISIRLNQPKYKDFMVLYLFDDEEHIRFAFRGLAEKILVEYPLGK